jgi:hypothetical protein
MNADHEMPPPLYFVLRSCLTSEWQSTSALRSAVSHGQYRPAMNDVAVTLRRLRRDGCAERVSKVEPKCHYWRRAE